MTIATFNILIGNGNGTGDGTGGVVTDWILATGLWNDSGFWRDDENWID